MIKERQDRRLKQIRQQVEKDLGYVAIFALGLKSSPENRPITNWREIRIGYSADPATNLKQGQKWNAREFELLALLWAIDRSQALKVYKELTNVCNRQKAADGPADEFIGPWYGIPMAQDYGSGRMIMEFAIQDAAAALGVRLLTETEYEGMIMHRLNRVLDVV